MSINLIEITFEKNGSASVYHVPTQHVNDVEDTVAEVLRDLADNADKLPDGLIVGFRREQGRALFVFEFAADFQFASSLEADELRSARATLHEVLEPSIRERFRMPESTRFEQQG